VNDVERAIAMEKLSEARDEAMRIQLDLHEVDTALMHAEEAGDGPAMARWHAREAELLHRQAEVADHVAAIAAALWGLNEPPVPQATPLSIVH
jgi:hypothetical protein